MQINYLPFRKKGCPVYFFSARYVASLMSPSSTIPVFATPSNKLAENREQINKSWIANPIHRNFIRANYHRYGGGAWNEEIRKKQFSSVIMHARFHCKFFSISSNWKTVIATSDLIPVELVFATSFTLSPLKVKSLQKLKWLYILKKTVTTHYYILQMCTWRTKLIKNSRGPRSVR